MPHHCRSIRRIIFYSVVKLQQKENGDREICSLTVSQTLQIAGKFEKKNQNTIRGNR